MSAKLKPCPFCGGTDIRALGIVPRIACEDCSALGPMVKCSKPENAQELWNSRVEDRDEELEEECALVEARIELQAQGKVDDK